MTLLGDHKSELSLAQECRNCLHPWNSEIPGRDTNLGLEAHWQQGYTLSPRGHQSKQTKENDIKGDYLHFVSWYYNSKTCYKTNALGYGTSKFENV